MLNIHKKRMFTLSTVRIDNMCKSHNRECQNAKVSAIIHVRKSKSMQRNGCGLRRFPLKIYKTGNFMALCFCVTVKI